MSPLKNIWDCRTKTTSNRVSLPTKLPPTPQTSPKVIRKPVCVMTRSQSFPLTHMLMINTVIFSVCIVYNLPNVGLSLFALSSRPALALALAAAAANIVLTLPLGLVFGIFVYSVDPCRSLPLYLGKFAEIYFLIALIQEVVFRGLIQNLCENRLGLFLDEHLNFHDPEEYERDDDQDPDAAKLTVFAFPRRDISFSALSSGLPLQAWISLLITSSADAVASMHRQWQLLDVLPGVGRFLVFFIQSVIYGWVWRQSRSVAVSALTNALCQLFWFVCLGVNPAPS